jgi:hypothetical protein
MSTDNKITLGYHVRSIPRGKLGESSKIQEELCELCDAEEQGVKILVACELADIYGALQARAEREGLTMVDLAKMNFLTKRAFQNGHRL